jgi:hypothetical protein
LLNFIVSPLGVDFFGQRRHGVAGDWIVAASVPIYSRLVRPVRALVEGELAKTRAEDTGSADNGTRMHVYVSENSIALVKLGC